MIDQVQFDLVKSQQKAPITGAFFLASLEYSDTRWTPDRGTGMNDTTTRRTDSVRVKLAPEMLARLENQAKAFGMPVATVCAFAVADWIQRQENNLSMARMAVLDMSRKASESMEMTEEQMEKIFTPMLVELAKQQGALSQQNLPLEHEGPEGAK